MKMRSALLDVVLAQEVPLFVDDSMPIEQLLSGLLGESLTILDGSRFGPDLGEEKSSLSPTVACMTEVTTALMALRASITLLSERSVVSAYLGKEGGKSMLFADALKLAYPDDLSRDGKTDLVAEATSKFMSSFPVHEARLVHVLSLFRRLRVEEGVLDNTPRSVFESRVSQLAKLCSSEESLSAIEPEDVDSDRRKTPPSQPLGNPPRTSEGSENAAATRSQATSSRNVSQSTVSSDNSGEEDEAASHLIEAAIAQMAELGLPRSWSELALRRTGGTNIEAAVHFCLERGGEMETLLAEERERERESSGGESSRRRPSRAETTSHLLRQLTEMGFPSRWCSEALAATGNNVDEALTWILTNGERLSAEDEGMDDLGDEEVDDDEEDEDGEEEEEEEDEDEDSETTPDQSAPTATHAGENMLESENDTEAKPLDSEPDAVRWSGSVSCSLTENGTMKLFLRQQDVCKLAGPTEALLDTAMLREETDVEMVPVHGASMAGDATDGTLSQLNGAVVGRKATEKLRLILGGSGSSEFKYPPPPGYKGVGEAVLNAVKEREVLVAKESVLDTESKEEPGDKRFLCDFSDGEHGHELMAWAHRYYGSDASVHLGSGSGRHKQAATSTKNSAGSSEDVAAYSLMRRIDAEWSKCRLSSDLSSGDIKLGNEALEPFELDEKQVVSKMKGGLYNVGASICTQAYSECLLLASLTARKLLLHVIIAMQDDFDPSCMVGVTESEHAGSLRFWRMIELSASLRSAGWVGEAGAMAIAAETLGLAISSADGAPSRPSGATTVGSGLVSVSDLDEGVVLASAGIVQLLSSVFDGSFDFNSTESSLVASSEAAIGSDGGGGVLTFLLRGLQSSVCKSEMIRRVFIGSIRRSVRQLAAVDYETDDSALDYTEDEHDIEKATALKEKNKREEVDAFSQPDARLTSFFSGLLLSAPVAKSTCDLDKLHEDLLEAWSVGLLSASLPFRMICAFTVAGILRTSPKALSAVVTSLPTLANFFARLRGTVARRIWAERAAMPVCSRYCQAMVELLCSVSSSVKIAHLPSSFMSTWETIWVDAATPVPLEAPKDNPDWESEHGWISTDRNLEVMTGSVERFAVDWKTPSRSAVRALMESGDGPPMLREGCKVMRGIDWDQSKCGDADGKDSYDAEKTKREEDKKRSEESPEGPTDPVEAVPDAEDPSCEPDSATKDNDMKEVEAEKQPEAISKKKRKKMPSPKLPIGTVLSIESWGGVPAMGRKVRWARTGEIGVYRYGGAGGNYDLSHVEVNEKGTRVRKRYPLPESAEQCAARHGFGRPTRESMIT
ncbi:MAG: hypothetical protein SGILL_000791 [Bacillariaceae sp.]